MTKSNLHSKHKKCQTSVHVPEDIKIKEIKNRDRKRKKKEIGDQKNIFVQSKYTIHVPLPSLKPQRLELWQDHDL